MVRVLLGASLLAMVATVQAFFLAPPGSSLTTTLNPTSATARWAQTQEAGVGGGGLVERKGALSVGMLSLATALGLVTAGPLRGEAAEEIPLARNSMGGTLEIYTDIAKGFKMLKPSGWNEFGGSPDTYVIKWVDIVNQQDEIVILNSTPVKSSTASVAALGDVKEVGERLAKGRNAKLVSATDRVTEGQLFYEFVFKGDKISEAFELVVARSRIWSLSCTASNKRFPKLDEFYKNILRGFLVKL